MLKEIFNYNFSILRKSEYREVFIGSALLLFVVFAFLYGMFRIPVLDFGIVRMSPITALDVLYIIAVSALSGVLLTLFKFKIETSFGSKGAGTGSFVAGFLGAVCPTCQGVTIAAFGSTVAAIPLEFLIPYLNVLRVASLLLLGFAVYSTASTVYTKTCPTSILPIRIKISAKSSAKEDFSLFENRFVVGSIVAIIMLVLFNQVIAMSAFGSLVPASGSTVAISSGSLKLEYGTKTTLKPMPLASGEQPAFAGYKSKVKSLPTISELAMTPSTGDLAQDLLNNVIPRGVPWYGQEAGVSFDDPITSQKLWAKGRAIQLDSAKEERWKRIVNSFTCDYCCGSPQNPTIITRCGCAHAAAAQGMAKWFIQNYGDKYSDEEIYGEMARWYAVWYPGPTIKRIVQEATV